MMKATVTMLALASYVAAYGYNAPNPAGPFPDHTESGQYGTNNCGTTDGPTKNCQTLHINSPEDFCLYAPPAVATVGDVEEKVVSYCTARGHGSRLMPKGALTGVHWIETPNFVQITGTGDFTKINVKKGDEGGELDPHGATGQGNPIGALVIATFDNKLTQATEWHEFLSDSEFCIRACKPGGSAAAWCQHIYDVMGCYWNDPGNYNTGSFDSCKADNPAHPPGLYIKNGKTSTWHQGVNPTPAGQNAGKSSDCVKIASPGGNAYTSGGKTTSSAKPTATGKSCSKTSDCKGQKKTPYAHDYCSNKQCSFRCDSGYKLKDGKCTKASASSPSGKSCSQTTDCKGQPVPAYGHELCDRSSKKCSFGCNKGYKQSGSSCVKA